MDESSSCRYETRHRKAIRTIIVVKAARGEKFLVRAKRVSFCLILRLLSDGVLGTIFGTWKKRGMRGEEREVKMDGVK